MRHPEDAFEPEGEQARSERLQRYRLVGDLVGELLAYLSDDELADLIGVQPSEEPDELPPMPDIEPSPEFRQLWQAWHEQSDLPLQWRVLKMPGELPFGDN